MTTTTIEPDSESLRQRAQKLRLYGLLTKWNDLVTAPWVPQLIELEERERRRRSHEYRIKNANIGAFKPIADFDWKHPDDIDRALIEDLFSLDFITSHTNIVVLGPNGVGKTMLAQNLAYEAVVRGHPVRFVSSSDLLNDLAAVDGSALKLRLKRYVSPKVLAIDEVGYLSYDNRYADLLYQVVSRRYEAGGSIILTTNKPFSEWNQVFESAACVVSLIDRLCHRSEVVKIHGKSYRQKEAALRQEQRRAQRKSRPSRAK